MGRIKGGGTFSVAGMGINSVRPTEVRRTQKDCERCKEMWKDFEICGGEEVHEDQIPQEEAKEEIGENMGQDKGEELK